MWRVVLIILICNKYTIPTIDILKQCWAVPTHNSNFTFTLSSFKKEKKHVATFPLAAASTSTCTSNNDKCTITKVAFFHIWNKNRRLDERQSAGRNCREPVCVIVSVICLNDIKIPDVKSQTDFIIKWIK